MIKRKWLATLGMSTILFGSVLAGCSDSEAGGSKAGGEDGGDNQEVTVTLSTWASSPAEEKRLDTVLASFEEEHPNISVEKDVIAEQYMDIMKTRLIGGEAADVFYLDAFEAPALIKTGVLQPLEEFITDEFNIDDFEKSMLNAFKGEEGKQYGIPKDYSTLALFYNKEMFKKAGLDNPPKTWEEFLAYSEKLTKDGVYGFGVAPELARLFAIGQTQGGQLVKDDKANFASPEVVKAIQPIVDQHLKAETSVQATEVGATWGGDMFGQEKVAMVIEGPWAMPYLEDNFADVKYDTAEIPTIDGKKHTMAFTVAYVMNKQSKHKKASWELISYLTGKEGMKEWVKGGVALPTRESVAKELGFEKDELRDVMVAGAEYATVWQAGPNLPIIMQNFNNQFTAAFLGERPLEEALKEAQKTANNEIEANK